MYMQERFFYKKLNYSHFFFLQETAPLRALSGEAVKVQKLKLYLTTETG